MNEPESPPGNARSSVANAVPFQHTHTEEKHIHHQAARCDAVRMELFLFYYQKDNRSCRPSNREGFLGGSREKVSRIANVIYGDGP